MLPEVYKVINMDIFLTKLHRFASEGLINPPGAVWITFMMDGCAFLGFKISVTIHSHYNSDCVWLKEESHIHLEWLKGE